MGISWGARLLEVVVCGMFGLMGIAALANHAFVGGICLLVFTAIAVACFELRFAGHRSRVLTVHTALELVGESDFDAPVAVVQRAKDEVLEELAANHVAAAMLSQTATRFCVDGTWKGKPVEIGTAVVAGRDGDLTISYVCAKDPSLQGLFRAMTKGAATTFSRMGLAKNPQTTGDAAFDEAWVVDADPALCQLLLDARTRATLMELQSRLPWMQVASVEVTRIGMIVRWPGDTSGSEAAALRDLMLDLRDRVASAAALTC